MEMPSQEGFDRVYESSDQLPEGCAVGHAVVYLVEAGDRCKVGITQAPRRRLQSLERGMGRRADRLYVSPQCLNHREIERILHDALDETRTLGEWFAYDFDKIQPVIASHYFYVTVDGLHEGAHKHCRYAAEKMEQLITPLRSPMIVPLDPSQARPMTLY